MKDLLMALVKTILFDIKDINDIKYDDIEGEKPTFIVSTKTGKKYEISLRDVSCDE